MLRKIAIFSFAAAVLTVFTLGVSSADTDKGMMKQDKSSMERDKNMKSDKSSMKGMKKDKISMDLTPAPKAQTQAKGETEFKLDEDGKTLTYKIKVDDIENATQAHIHAVGPDGAPGDVIAPLYPAMGTGALPSGKDKEAKKGEFSGTLAEGKITDAQLTGKMKGKSTSELYEMLRTGKAGVNVHTQKHPSGEIWGVSKVDETAVGK